MRQSAYACKLDFGRIQATDLSLCVGAGAEETLVAVRVEDFTFLPI